MKRVLVVEDDVATRHALVRLLSRNGWDVIAAGSIGEGLALLASEPRPSCMVLDLDLPDGQGETVLLRVRTDGIEVQVVVASGSGDAQRIRSVKELRPDAFLQKPINFDELVRVFGDP